MMGSSIRSVAMGTLCVYVESVNDLQTLRLTDIKMIDRLVDRVAEHKPPPQIRHHTSIVKSETAV